MNQYMSPYRHHVSGFFARYQDAESVHRTLLARGIPANRLQLLGAGTPPPSALPQTDSNRVLDDILTKGAIGTAVGTGVGALAELALVAANVSLFVASPLIAPLVLLGWGASLGGFIGATAGAGSDVGSRNGKFPALVHDAIASGQTVLIAATHSEEETAFALKIIMAASGDIDDQVKT